MIAKDQETVLGVISGYTCYKEVYIDDVLVFSEHREECVGKALIKAVEKRFQKDCFNNINVVTNEFQAPLFYEKC